MAMTNFAIFAGESVAAKTEFHRVFRSAEVYFYLDTDVPTMPASIPVIPNNSWIFSNFPEV